MIQDQPFFRPEISEGRASTTSESAQHGRGLPFPEKVHKMMQRQEESLVSLLCSSAPGDLCLHV